MNIPFHQGTPDNAREIVLEALTCITDPVQPQLKIVGKERSYAVGIDTADKNPNGSSIGKGLFIGVSYSFTVDDAGFNTINNQLHSSLANFTPAAEGCVLVGPGILPGTIISKVLSSGTIVLNQPVNIMEFQGIITFCPVNKSVNDIIYINPHGFGPTSVGLGAPQCNEAFRVHVLSDPERPAQGGLRIGTNILQQGLAFAVGPVNDKHNVLEIGTNGSVKPSVYLSSTGKPGISAKLHTDLGVLVFEDGLLISYEPS